MEWFFEKKAPATENATRIHELAMAVRSLPADVKNDLGDIEALARLLSVDKSNPLLGRYCDAVLRCRPPLHHLSERSHGLVIIRWLLHRILPHTCFLLDQLHLAARLRVTPASLQACLSKEAPLVKALSAFEYHGPLKRFDGTRWWRGGIEQWLWEQTNGQSGDDELVLKLLKSIGCQMLAPAGIAHPVVTVDKNLTPEQQLSPFAESIALRLDDWPDYAEPAYATRATIEKNPEMHAFISN